MSRGIIRLPLLMALSLSACAVGPDFNPSALPQGKSYGHATQADHEGPGLSQGKEIPGDWWRLFQSEALNTLIRTGLENSPTLEAARAKLKATQHTTSADRSSMLYPTVDASLNAARQKISGATFGRAGNGSLFNLRTGSVNLSYSIDMFGGGRRYIEFDEAQIDYDALQLEAARNTLIANIITAAISEASLREQIQVQQELIESTSKQLRLTEQRYQAGAIARSALLAQQSALANTRTSLPVLQKQLATERHRLLALVGYLPGETNLPSFEMNQLTTPQALPLSLPSALTRQRPDIRAAEAVLHQRSALVGVATANLYPKLSLSASYGTESTKFSKLFSAGSGVWGLAAGLTQPLFNGGELRARKRVAEAEFDQAAAMYRQSVIDAFRDVSDVLQALDSDGQGLELQQKATALASQTLALVEAQYDIGAVSYIELLDARRSQQQAETKLIQARAAVLNDSAALMYALGGGWWNRNESMVEEFHE